MSAETVVETDARSRVVLPGHRNERFIMEELEDGVIRLVPAAVISEAQLQYLTTPELRSLLTTAAAATTITRRRRERRPE
jgi:hypothetical protein